jgi:hypothetical protein
MVYDGTARDSGPYKAAFSLIGRINRASARLLLTPIDHITFACTHRIRCREWRAYAILGEAVTGA